VAQQTNLHDVAEAIVQRSGGSKVFVQLASQLLARRWVDGVLGLPAGTDEAYSLIMRRSISGIPSDQRAGLALLMRVVLASREPLTPHDIELLKMWGQKESLPLW
jgi:hypothetical protein